MDAIVEIAVDAIASRYPNAELMHATCHDEGKITGQFLDPKIGQVYDFKVGNGFLCSPTIFCKVSLGDKEIRLPSSPIIPTKLIRPNPRSPWWARVIQVLLDMFVLLVEATIFLAEIFFFEFKQSIDWVVFAIPPEEKENIL